MASLDSKKTERNLKKKGYTDSTNRSSDHIYLDYKYNGKFITYTKISHGSKNIERGLINKMAKQCKLSKKEFIDLANCPLSKDRYIEILKDKGEIDDE